MVRIMNAGHASVDTTRFQTRLHWSESFALTFEVLLPAIIPLANLSLVLGQLADPLVVALARANSCSES